MQRLTNREFRVTHDAGRQSATLRNSPILWKSLEPRETGILGVRFWFGVSWRGGRKMKEEMV